MATVLYLVLDRETGEVAFSAPATLRRCCWPPTGRASWRGGVGADRGHRSGRVPRGPGRDAQGSTLLLYTDGLVERRDVPLADSLDQLAEQAGVADQGLTTLCDQRVARRCSASASRTTTWRYWP